MNALALKILLFTPANILESIKILLFARVNILESIKILLFARVNIFESIKRHSEQSSRLDMTDIWLALAAFGGLAVLLLALSKLFPSNEKAHAVNSPLRLFWALCRTHRLRLSDRWLLWRISREYGLKDPARLFVEPELLDADLIGAGLAGKAAAVKSLHERLFEGLNEDGF